MTHARTLTRYACLAGLIAGLLAPVSSLALEGEANVTNVRSTGTSTPTHIQARVNANYRFLGNDPRIYTRLSVNIPRRSLGRAALSYLRRGVKHPAFMAALFAAGLVVEGTDIFKSGDPNVLVDTDDPDFIGDFTSDNGYPCMYATHNGPLTNSPGAAAASYTSYYSRKLVEFSQDGMTDSGGYAMLQGCPKFSAVYNNPPNTAEYLMRTRTISANIYSTGNPPDPNPYVPAYEPATDAEIEQADQYISPALVDQIYNSPDDVPEWEEEISIIGIPATEVQTRGNIAPAVARRVGEWAANTEAQLKGQPEPYPDSDVVAGGNTAEDEMLEQWNEEIPPFEEVEPEWQVEEIDSLPSFSFGLGSGSCPAPVTIPHPLGGSFTLEFQKFCDLASMIRGAVIAICMILALYIVLGTRATTS